MMVWEDPLGQMWQQPAVRISSFPSQIAFRRDDAEFAVIEHPDSHCSFPAIHSGEDSFFYFIEIDQHGWLLFILLPRQQGNGFDVVPRAHLDVLNIFSVCF